MGRISHVTIRISYKPYVKHKFKFPIIKCSIPFLESELGQPGPCFKTAAAPRLRTTGSEYTGHE